MKETFKQVTERRGGQEISIKHLYRRQYQDSRGQWRTHYYAIFTDWKEIRRKFSLGDNFDDARDELGGRKVKNKGQYDWDAAKRNAEDQRRRAVTLSQWGATYFRERLSPKRLRPASEDREKRSFALLERILADIPVADIKKARLLDYRKKRRSEGVGDVTINRELSFLRKLLNVATDPRQSEEPKSLANASRRHRSLEFIATGALRKSSRASRSLSGRADPYNSGFFIK